LLGALKLKLEIVDVSKEGLRRIMAFRQKNKDLETTWLKDHREGLLQSGLPLAVIEDGRRWNYLLLHGYDPGSTRWDASWITKEQAEHLLMLIRLQYPNPAGLDLILELEKRINSE
jgi:hypothetical protein